MPNLTVTKVRNAKPQRDAKGQAVTTKFADGSGLHLLVKPSGSKSWILRVQVDGKRHDIGLGSADVDGAGRDGPQVRKCAMAWEYKKPRMSGI